MSVQAMAKVWEMDLPHQDLLVLLALADHADHLGEHIFPSLDLLAWKTGYSTRQLQRILQALVTRGILIKVQDGRGRSRTTEYAFDFAKAPQKAPFQRKHVKMSPFPDDPQEKHDRAMSPFPEKTRQNVAFSDEPKTEKHDILSKKHDIAMSPKPSGTVREKQEEEKTPPFPPSRGAWPGFEEWWAEYPDKRRVGEDLCRRLWCRHRLEAQAAAILAHTRAMRTSAPWQRGIIPKTTTYLREEHWKTPLASGGTGRSTEAIHAAMLAKLAAEGQVV